jgi:integrase
MKVINRWVLHKETQRGKTRFVIRRWVVVNGKGTTERLPVKQYRSIRDDESELKLFVIRLNERSKEIRTKDAVVIKHAFISPALLDSYRDFLLAQIPTRAKALAEYQYLVKYFLGFFISRKNLPDPLQWHKIHKTDWASYLESKEVPPATGTKKQIIQAANKFIRWLHDQRPQECPPLVFEPFSRAKFRAIEAQRRLSGEVEEGRYISEEDWDTICNALSGRLRGFVLLAYSYGLRIGETLGIALQDVKQGYLSIERQLLRIPDGEPVYGPLKGRDPRKVPHWCCSPNEVYTWVSAIESSRMHKDTLGRLWGKLMEDLGLAYEFHDLRHTWITRMLRVQNSRDVQLAAGHRSIETTMGYAHDDRVMDDEVFTPKKSG